MSQGQEQGSFESLWKVIESDVESHGREQGREFPLSTMCRATAERIWRTRPPRTSVPAASGAALDIGTGTGVHAMVMAARGYPRVEAIDVSREAVGLARRRWLRLRSGRGASRCGFDRGRIRFSQLGVDEAGSIGPFALIAFNPPGFFNPLGAGLDDPAARGVYLSQKGTDDDPSSTFQYRFFEKAVLPGLAVGGHAICTWPGMSRLLAEEGDGVTVHPLQKLRRWFGLSFDRSPQGDSGFFRCTSPIRGDYGLGPEFLENLRLSWRAGRFSSFFRIEDEDRGGFPSFDFGVLHVQRTDEAAFRLIDADAPETSS